MQRCLDKWDEAMDERRFHTITCGICGECEKVAKKATHQEAGFFPIDFTKQPCLCMSGSEAANIDRFETEEQTLYSYTVRDGQKYHVYREAVYENMTAACRSCYEKLKKKEIPAFSLAAGYDYGNLRGYLKAMGLREPTLLEQILVSAVIPMFVSLKCQPIGTIKHCEYMRLKGHVLCASLDASTVFLDSVPDPTTVAKYIKVVFVGHQTAYAAWKLRKMIRGVLEVDGSYVYRLLELMKRHNPRSVLCRLNRNLARASTETLTMTLYVDRRYNLKIKYDMTTEMEELAAKLLAMTVHEDDPDVIRHEASMADDTTGTGLNSGATFSHVSEDEPEPEPVFKYLFLSEVPETGSDFKLRSVLTVLYPDLNVTIDNTSPINHFIDSDKIYLDGFPLLFFLGEGVRDGKPLGNVHRHKLMRHFRRAHAQDRRLLFVMTNYLMRDMAAVGAAAKAKSNMETFAKISDQIRSQDFRKKCEFAAKYPKSKEAKEVLHFVDKLMVVTGGRVRYDCA